MRDGHSELTGQANRFGRLRLAQLRLRRARALETLGTHWFELVEPNDETRTAPVSHQKQPQQGATNAIKSKRKRSKFNDRDHYPPAHNGLVAGSSPAGPTIANRFSLQYVSESASGQNWALSDPEASLFCYRKFGSRRDFNSKPLSQSNDVRRMAGIACMLTHLSR